MLVGYFRRCGLDLSFTGAVVIALLVTAGIRAGRAGLGGSCASGWTGEAGEGEGVAVGFSDSAGLGVGCDVLPSRPRDSFESKLLVMLVGREGCADAFSGSGSERTDSED